FTWLIEKRSHGWAKAAGVWASARYSTWFGRDDVAEREPERERTGELHGERRDSVADARR
ncbi:hypothetical protein SB767_29295, partial [Bacillus sp. SIMBA_069]